jgi:hypothetical protein
MSIAALPPGAYPPGATGGACGERAPRVMKRRNKSDDAMATENGTDLFDASKDLLAKSAPFQRVTRRSRPLARSVSGALGGRVEAPGTAGEGTLGTGRVCSLTNTGEIVESGRCAWGVWRGD